MAGTDPRVGADERLQKLRIQRATERKNAIANGLMSDPDVPVPLSEAISLVGTCEDMCPEFERVTRIAQKDVPGPEMDPATRGGKFRDQVPDEQRMVKKFRRPAAGIEEQIPSDLRTPKALTRSLNFLVNDIIGKASSLETVHAFVWDRTRGVRNDFSVQQFKDLPRLKVWMRCLERVVRFHFLSRHQVGGRFPHVAPNYDHHQDGEQGFKSLFSLLKCYEDAVAIDSSYKPPNEPEFQAYKILTLIPRNDIDAVKKLIEALPEHVRNHPHLQHAYNIYVSASTALNSDKVSLPVAQKNIMAFWGIIGQSNTTYMLACTAEIFFQEIRKLALHTVLRTFGKNKGRTTPTDWSLGDLKTPLGLDTEEEARDYVEAHEVGIKQTDDGTLRLERKGNEALTLSRLQSFKSPAIQYFCGRLVESKREGRSFPDVINQPDVAGVSIEEDDDEESLFLPQNPSVQTGPPAGRRIAKARGARRLNPTAQNFSLTDGSSDESAAESTHNPFGGSSTRNQTFPTPFQNPFGSLSNQNQTQTPSSQNNPFAPSKPASDQAAATQNPFGASGFGRPSTGFGADSFGKPSGDHSAQNANPFAKSSGPSPFQTAQTANPFGKPATPSPFATTQDANPFGKANNSSGGETTQPSPAPFGNPPPSFQFPNLGTNAPTSGVFATSQPSTTQTNAPAPTFSFTGGGFGQNAPTTGLPQQSASFDFGTKQDDVTAPQAAPGVQSAPSSFNFDFDFGGKSSIAKSNTGFNNPFASAGQPSTPSFAFSKSQPESKQQQKPADTSFFQFSAGSATPATQGSQTPGFNVPSEGAPKTTPAFAFNAGSTTNTSAIPAFATSGSSFNAGEPKSFDFTQTTNAAEPTRKVSAGQMQLPPFGVSSSETKASSKSTPTATQSALPAQTPAFQFGPSAAQQKVEQEKQHSTSDITPGMLQAAPTPEKDSAPSPIWNSATESPSAAETSMLPPVIIKKTPKRERPPVNEFGHTEKQQKRHDDCMDYIIRELFLLPNQGILDQYIDWKMWPVFEEARRDREVILEQERFTLRRKNMLLRKYCILWKAKASILRHRRQGRERRERLERIRLEKLARLEEEKRRLLYAANAQNIIAQAEESLRRSQASRAKAPEPAEPEPEVQPATSFAVQTPSKPDLRHSIIRRTPASEPSRKPTMNNRAGILTSKGSTSKKAEKESTADHAYTPPRPLSGDPLRQSADDPLPAKLSTVRSDYFRLKAMGLKHLSPAYYKNTVRWRERENSGSASVFSIPSTSASSQRTSASPPPLHLGHSVLDADQDASTGMNVSARKSVRFDESVKDLPSDNDARFGSSILYNGVATSNRANESDDSVNIATSSVKRLRFSDGNGLSPQLQRVPDTSPSGKRKYASSLMEQSSSLPASQEGAVQDVFASAMDEDERRIARVKALTSRMAWQTDIFRDPKDDLLPLPSLSASLGEDYRYKDKEDRPSKKIKLSLSNDQEQISLEDARKKLPAYWFRDSKFVPRSEYGLGPKAKKADDIPASTFVPLSQAQGRASVQEFAPPFASASSMTNNQQRVNGVSASTISNDVIVIDSSDDDAGHPNHESEARAQGAKVKQEMLDGVEVTRSSANHDHEVEYLDDEENDEEVDEDDEDNAVEEDDGDEEEEEEEEEDGEYDEDEEDEGEEEEAEEEDEDFAGGSFEDPIVL